MRHLSGPTWRRLKACLEFKYREIPVPSVGGDDRVKTLGLLLGLSRGDEKVLKDEMLQFRLGHEAAHKRPDGDLQEEVHRLSQALPLERWMH